MTTYTTKKLDTTGSGIAAAPGALADADLAVVGQSNDGNLYRTTLGALKTFFQTTFASLFVAKAGDTMTGPLEIDKPSAVLTNLNGVPSCKVRVRGEAGKPANFVFITEGLAGANGIGALYRDSTDSLGYWGYKARGTEAAPVVVNQNDGAVDLTGWNWSGASFVRVGLIRLTTIAATPSPTDMESQWVFSGNAPGAVSNTTIMTLSHRYGLSMFGVQAITDKGCPVRPVTTVAGLAAFTGQPNGASAIVTDSTSTALGSIVAGGGANRVPVNYDGANWRIG